MYQEYEGLLCRRFYERITFIANKRFEYLIREVKPAHELTTCQKYLCKSFKEKGREKER